MHAGTTTHVISKFHQKLYDASQLKFGAEWANSGIRLRTARIFWPTFDVLDFVTFHTLFYYNQCSLETVFI